MASDYYEKQTDKGLLTLRLVGGAWKLKLYPNSNPNGVLIRSDYMDPAQAALDANHADFGIQEFDELFRGVYVPSDLWGWGTSPMQHFRRSGRP